MICSMNGVPVPNPHCADEWQDPEYLDGIPNPELFSHRGESGGLGLFAGAGLSALTG